MYGLRIGLGGTGSNARDSKPPSHPHTHPPHVQHATHPPSASATLEAASPTPSTSSLLSRLASSSSSPFLSSDDSTLSHVLSLTPPDRPVPLSIDDAAAQVKRVERKQKKADRKKKPDEEHKEQTDAPSPADSTGRDSAAYPLAAPANGHHGEDVQSLPSPTASVAAKKKKKNKKETKEAKQPSILQDDEELRLSVGELRSLLSCYAETQVRAVCKALLASALTTSLPSLTAKQRREVQDRMLAEHVNEQSALRAIQQHPAMQRAMSEAVSTGHAHPLS